MSDRRLELATRRAALLAQCDAQRGRLGQSAREIEGRLHKVDRAISVARRVLSQPLLLAAGVAAFVMIGPSRLLGWASRGIVLISTGRQLLRRLR